MYKRSQEIPEKLIYKQSHKYLMKKTLINTKFQWLMKYINSQNQIANEGRLSNAIQITKKEKIQIKNRKVLSDKLNIDQNKIKNNDQTIKHKLPSSLFKRNTLSSRQRCITQQSVFLNKSKMRNKSLAINIFKNRNSNLLVSSLNKRTSSRLKTEPIYQRSNTKDRYWQKDLQGQAFISPWNMDHQPSTCDFNSLL